MFNVLKRTLVFALVLAMTLSVIGCGGKKPANNADGGTSSGGAATGGNSAIAGVDLTPYILDSDALLAKMPAELKGTKIVLLNWYNPDDREEKPVVAAFEQKTGIDVVYRVTDYGGYVREVAKMLATNEQLDVMRMKAPEMGALKLLQPLSVTGFDFSGKEWDQGTMDMYTVGEKQYGAALRYTPYFLPTLVYYNSETIADMEFEDPYELWKQGKWTWSKMSEMATTWVNENGADYIGACLWAHPSNVIGESFIKTNEDNVTFSLDLTNQKTIDCYKFIEERKQLGIFTNLNDGFDQAKQKLLFAMHDASAVQTSSSYFSKTRMRKQLRAVAVPVWDGFEDVDGFKAYEVPMMENIAFGVPKSAKNAKAVPYFLGYLCNLKNYNSGVGEDQMFFDEQIREVYLELLTLEKRSGKLGLDEVCGFDGTITNLSWSLFMSVDPTQINSWLQEREYIMRTSMELYNEEREKLK